MYPRWTDERRFRWNRDRAWDMKNFNTGVTEYEIQFKGTAVQILQIIPDRMKEKDVEVKGHDCRF